MHVQQAFNPLEVWRDEARNCFAMQNETKCYQLAANVCLLSLKFCSPLFPFPWLRLKPTQSRFLFVSCQSSLKAFQVRAVREELAQSLLLKFWFSSRPLPFCTRHCWLLKGKVLTGLFLPLSVFTDCSQDHHNVKDKNVCVCEHEFISLVTE